MNGSDEARTQTFDSRDANRQQCLQRSRRKQIRNLETLGLRSGAHAEQHDPVEAGKDLGGIFADMRERRYDREAVAVERCARRDDVEIDTEPP